MAINPETQFPGQINPSDADYTYGSARNVTVPGDGTGTPFVAALVNDWFGFFQGLLNAGGIVPSATPDTVLVSQYLQGLPFAAEPADNFRMFNRWDATYARYIAHRGASEAFPENTIAALNAARGMTDVEFDIQLTSDNEWILMHDTTVDRTTDGTGAVTSFTLAGIKALDAGSWKNAFFSGAKVPTLDEALLACRLANLRPVVELKVTASDANRQKVLDSCIRHTDNYNFMLASTGPTELTEYRRLDKRANLLMFAPVSVADPIGDAAPLHPVVMGLDEALTRAGGAAYVKTFHDAGFNTIVFTLSSAGEIEEMFGLGVGGALTDNLTGVAL